MNAETAQKAAELLDQVAAGELEASIALTAWPVEVQDDLLEAAWHDLSHYANDGDIREKDEKYKAYQVDLLLRRADELRLAFGIT